MLAPLRQTARRSLLSSFLTRTLSTTISSDPTSSSIPPPPDTPKPKNHGELSLEEQEALEPIPTVDFTPPPPLTTGHSPGTPDFTLTRAVTKNPFFVPPGTPSSTFIAPPPSTFASPYASALISRHEQPIILDLPLTADPLLHYLTSSITRHGKRARASKIISKMLLHIHAMTRTEPLHIVRQAILMAAPSIKIKNNKRAATVVPVPMVLNEKSRVRGAVKWILDAVENTDKKAKSKLRVEERLAREIIRIVQGSSPVLEKKSALHKHAMLNRCVCFDGFF